MKQQQTSDSNSQGAVEIKPLPNLKCPRCSSTKTKFCYFNNYKTSQPRYRCYECNKFWTEGGNVRSSPSTGGEGAMKSAEESSSSSAATMSPLTSLSAPPPPPPLTITSATNDNVRGVGTLNFTRPRPEANQPPLKFVRVDINNLSLTQNFNGVLNPYMNFSQVQGQSNHVQGSDQFYQTTNDPCLAANLTPSNHETSYYMQPSNGNIFWNNNNQIGGTLGGNSSSSAWSAQFPDPEP